MPLEKENIWGVKYIFVRNIIQSTKLSFVLGLIGIGMLFASPISVSAAGGAEGGHGAIGLTFLFLAILLISAKIGGVIEKYGQPAVLGELGAGIILSALAFYGLPFIDDIRHSEIMAFFAELGAVILLFQIGLESNVKKMMKVGVSALIVAIIGVIAPFVIGAFVLSPLLFPDASLAAHLFVGASVVATSVGITAYVFQEMRMLTSRAAQTVLGAAVIDDVLGLIILAIVSAMATGGDLTPIFLGTLIFKAFGFLAIAVLLGNILAKTLSRLFSTISTGTGMKLTLALTFALVYAYLASVVGLAPIVGAFAAGLILDAVHFKNFDLPPIAMSLKRLRGFDKEEKEKIDGLIERHSHTHVEDLISSIGLLLIPVFFVYTGLQIDFASLLNPQLYVYALILGIAAIATKVVAGFGAKGSIREKLLVGTSMVPRGEVGLIFASVGKAIGAIDDNLFSVIIIVIIITTFAAPPAIKMLLKQVNEEEK